MYNKSIQENTLLESLHTLIDLALREDLGEAGDVTTNATIPASLQLHGRITAKAPGVIAGLAAVVETYKVVDPTVQITFAVEDGAVVSPGTVVCDVIGAGRSVLIGERTALNFLQRLSGIATLTAQFVKAVEGTKTAILDTRKTTPGWRLLEKYAVAVGGGKNHRIGLYDQVLIKDNHIDGAGSITAAVNAVRAFPSASGLPIIVEVKDLDEVREALALKVDRLLLDNMDLAQTRAAVELVDGRVALEASGNMSLDRVAAVAATGVDVISIGALTHSAPVLDLSMRLVPVSPEQ